MTIEIKFAFVSYLKNLVRLGLKIKLRICVYRLQLYYKKLLDIDDIVI
jgi:hypothetical protein